MTDIRIARSGDELAVVTYDFLLTPIHQLDTGQELATAATVALLTDALAGPDDTLPDPRSTDRRGWWADLEAGAVWGGWPIGSKLWLLNRAKITPAEARDGSTLARVEAYIREALQPFLDLKVASDIAVNVTRTDTNAIAGSVVLYRGPKAAIALQFDDLWGPIRIG
jgi:phage gp46-like protein